MKIVKEDENLIVIKDKNVFVFVIGIVFFLVGVAVIINPEIFSNQPPFWSGIVSIILSVFIIAVAKITTITLDKSTGVLRFVRRGLVGQSSKEYDLNQIKEVELSSVYTDSGKSKGHSYILSVILNNGEIIQINPGVSSVSNIFWKRIIPEKEMGMRIALFLGVSFKERRPPTISETLSTITSAVKDAIEKERENKKD